MRVLLIRSVVAILAVAAISGAYLYWYWNHPLDLGTETYVFKPGMTLRAFARELTSRGVFPESYSFVRGVTFSGHERDLKAGEYRFRNGMNARELLDQVISGRVIEYPLILIEGWSFQQFLAAIENAPKLTHTAPKLSPRIVMEHLGQAERHPEGMFYPDTYYYSVGGADLMILARAYNKMQALLQQQWESRSGNLPFKNSYEALILASIVEKETGRVDERRLIAGVFINRLRQGMRLQSDPTVIYGMGASFDGNLRLKDLKQDTLYNTYTRAGLPPTPIAMPGKESLAAVLHPADTRALYFVARGDGSHYFSETLREHNNAVIQYQLRGKPKSSKTKPMLQKNHNNRDSGPNKIQ